MFDFKNKYFSYQLWNALRLKSANHLRMYEILKQYETIGTRILSVEELKTLLWIGGEEYPRFGDFRNYVLDSCKQALERDTDICFTYEPYGKKGKGGKILSLQFTITKNENFADQIMLDGFIALEDDPGSLPAANRHDDLVELLTDACNNEFSKAEMEVLFDLVSQIIPGPVGIEHADYLQLKYHELQVQAKKRKISNRFGYLKRMIQSGLSAGETRGMIT
jgi:hypothetical protein